MADDAWPAKAAAPKSQINKVQSLFAPSGGDDVEHS
jgi:hypothetical protein